MANLCRIICLYLLTLLVLVVYSEGKSVTFNDCGSKGSKVLSVDITPCNSNPCIITKGKNSSITIDFDSTSVADNLTIEAFAKIAGARIPYPLPHPDACKDGGITCPTKNGKEYKLHLSMDVPSVAPSGLTLIVELDLVTGSKQLNRVTGSEVYTCIEIALKVA